MSFRYEALHSYFHAYGIGIMYPYKPYHGTKAEMTEKPRTYTTSPFLSDNYISISHPMKIPS